MELTFLKGNNSIRRAHNALFEQGLAEWNELDPELRHAPSVAFLNNRPLSIIRPPAKSVFGIYDPVGLS